MDPQVVLRTTRKLGQLHKILTSCLVQSLLRIHPNEITSQGMAAPEEWLEWLAWARETPIGWLDLVDYYTTGGQGTLPSIPPALRGLLDEVRQLQLPRHPVALECALPSIQATGMSPKKAHEVSRMVTYILETIHINGWVASVLRIVDIGAGQGYLTRTLKACLPSTRILALDADEEQIAGARRWEGRLLPPSSADSPPITHKTIHITPEALHATIDGWIAETPSAAAEHTIPVLLVGLHACGSLTLDIIRTYTRPISGGIRWRFAGAVIVGCCYNLMNAGDFPLSSCMKELSPTIDLPMSAYHLAAQVPGQWLSELSPPTPVPSVELALRKVTWRALLGKIMQQMQVNSNPPTAGPQNSYAPGRQLPWSRLPPSKMLSIDTDEIGMGATPEMRRLGRLRDTAYRDWGAFLSMAGDKMGVDFQAAKCDEQNDSLGRLIEVIHTLRCLLGPVVESTILLDRLAWVTESLQTGMPVNDQSRDKVSLVNLFDQATGSGRNIAIVIAPSIP